MAQRFKAAPKNFEPTPEEVDAVLHDVFTAMDAALDAASKAPAPDSATDEPAPVDYVTCIICGSSYGEEYSGYTPGEIHCPDCGSVIGYEYEDDDYGDW